MWPKKLSLLYLAETAKFAYHFLACGDLADYCNMPPKMQRKRTGTGATRITDATAGSKEDKRRKKDEPLTTKDIPMIVKPVLEAL